jgi:tetratricopeptide (TPR) repeat protein
MSAAADQTFQDAVAGFRARKFADAERLCKTVLASRPRHIGALNLLTITLMSVQRFAEAERYVAQALSLDRRFDLSFRNYGIILARLGKPELALAQFDQALALDPKARATWVSRGRALADLGHHDRALSDFDQAIALDSRQPDVFQSKAEVFAALKHFDEALAAYDNALALAPGLAEACNGRGNVLCELKRHDQALAAYDQALSLKPALADAWNGRGNALLKCRRYDEALSAYDKALALRPEFADAWNGCGCVFTELHRFAQAFAAYDKALALKPDLPEAWHGRGNVLLELKRYDEALAAYDQALSLKPDLADSWVGRGNVFTQLNRDADALSCYDRAIALKPDLPAAYFNKSLVKLSLGQYQEGWKLYEWRWQSRLAQVPPRTFSQPLWLGDCDLDGKTILVHAEQGLGDTIQFFRYLRLLRPGDYRVILEAPHQLIGLLRNQADGIEIIAEGDPLPHFDLHCPLMSLPLAFGTTLETIPAAIPYLRADQAKIAAWRARLGAEIKQTKTKQTRPTIGLVWSGKLNWRRDSSIPLADLAPIISDAAEWHVLQKDIRDRDQATLRELALLENHAPRLDDFTDTAALISHMDLVISIDTSVAHLTGALGKPLWLLLPFHPDFRWLRDRRDSPWYPTAKLFRQTVDRDWSDVIARIAEELKVFLAARA